MEMFNMIMTGLAWLSGGLCFFVLAAFPALLLSVVSKG